MWYCEYYTPVIGLGADGLGVNQVQENEGKLKNKEIETEVPYETQDKHKI